MPAETKIVLSDKELTLAMNAEWILTKQVVIEKICSLMESCISLIESGIVYSHYNSLIPFMPPKISKGEQYLGLPYVMLDHPRLFSGNDIFAVRTMFWWANFISITFHVAGSYKSIFENKVISNSRNADHEIFICIHQEQWHHHFEKENYQPLNHLSEDDLRKLFAERGFIKIALKYPLHEMDHMHQLLAEGYKKIGNVIG